MNSYESISTVLEANRSTIALTIPGHLDFLHAWIDVRAPWNTRQCPGRWQDSDREAWHIYRLPILEMNLLAYAAPTMNQLTEMSKGGGHIPMLRATM